MPKVNERKLEDVLGDERRIQDQILEQEKKVLVKLEEESEDVFGENLSQLRELEELSLNTRDREDLGDVLLSYDFIRRSLVSDIETVQKKLSKEEKDLEDRLEELSLERLDLNRKEEERKKIAHGQNVLWGNNRCFSNNSSFSNFRKTCC